MNALILSTPAGNTSVTNVRTHAGTCPAGRKYSPTLWAYRRYLRMQNAACRYMRCHEAITAAVCYGIVGATTVIITIGFLNAL